jgi:uncharacterized SAM-binding protein YcdF (DUF218 family)
MILRQLDILIYPPAINILLLLAALLLWRQRKIAITLVLLSTITLFIFSLPITSHQLAIALEKYHAIPPAKLQAYHADAIVVLGGGVISYTDEYQNSSLFGNAIMRLRYAAFVQRQTGLPILATGRGLPDRISEAETMQHILANDYGITNVRTETTSKTTHENAINSAYLLKKNNMQRILLVTSSLHMNRAVELFTQQGLEVIPAPTDLYSNYDIDWRYFIPDGDALSNTRIVLHEYLGKLWYWFKDITTN